LVLNLNIEAYLRFPCNFSSNASILKLQLVTPSGLARFLTPGTSNHNGHP